MIVVDGAQIKKLVDEVVNKVREGNERIFIDPLTMTTSATTSQFEKEAFSFEKMQGLLKDIEEKFKVPAAFTGFPGPMSLSYGGAVFPGVRLGRVGDLKVIAAVARPDIRRDLRFKRHRGKRKRQYVWVGTIQGYTYDVDKGEIIIINNSLLIVHPDDLENIRRLYQQIPGLSPWELERMFSVPRVSQSNMVNMYGLRVEV